MAVLTKVGHDLCSDESASADDHDFHGAPFRASPEAAMVPALDVANSIT
jgi:hypothetical protein